MILARLAVAVAVTAGLVAGPVRCNPMSLIDTPDGTTQPVGPASLVVAAAPPMGGSLTYTFATTGHLVSVYTILTTSAVVATRLPILTVTDAGSNVAMRIPLSAGVTATSATKLHWGIGLPYVANTVNAADVELLAPVVNDVFVTSGWKLTISVDNLDAGDSLSATDITLSSV